MKLRDLFPQAYEVAIGILGGYKFVKVFTWNIWHKERLSKTNYTEFWKASQGIKDSWTPISFREFFKSWRLDERK